MTRGDENVSGTVAEMRALGRRLKTSDGIDLRPVTPEVAGSSPVTRAIFRHRDCSFAGTKAGLPRRRYTNANYQPQLRPAMIPRAAGASPRSAANLLPSQCVSFSNGIA